MPKQSRFRTPRIPVASPSLSIREDSNAKEVNSLEDVITASTLLKDDILNSSYTAPDYPFHQGGRTPNVPVTLQAGEIFFTPSEGKDLVDKLEQWREVRVGLIKLKNEHSSALREVKEKKGRLAS